MRGYEGVIGITANGRRDARDTYDTHDTRDKVASLILGFDPICITKAHEERTLDALKVVLSWLKRRNVPETQRLGFVRTFLAVHNLNVDSEQLLNALNVQPFSCELAKSLGFCDESNCRMRLPPAERLILDTESVVIFHSSGELDVKIAGKRKIIPLKRFFKINNERVSINTAIFDEIFLECYYFPPNPPFDEVGALRVYQAWLEMADHVKTPVDADSGLEECVVEILTTKKPYFSLKLLKDGKVGPREGFFLEGNIIYVESELLRELLEQAGVRERREKVAKAVYRLLAGNSKLMRVGSERRYFWRFNLKAVQAILKRNGTDWEPDVRTEPLIPDLRMTDPEVGEDG